MPLVARQNSLTTTRPIVDASGVSSQEMRSWSQQVTLTLPITGEGSPEGVIEAEITQLYMDTLGVAGAILYIKRDEDDGLGDKTKGWIAV